jgi:hypothetical protein
MIIITFPTRIFRWIPFLDWCKTKDGDRGFEVKFLCFELTYISRELGIFIVDEFEKTHKKVIESEQQP